MVKPDMLRRNAALQKTADKYRGKPFVWGKFDCVKMARSHLVAMGHRGLPKVKPYKSAVGAKSSLKAARHKDLESLFDSILPRIAPAEMLPGDLALMQGDGLFDAVTICVGRKQLGWFEGEDEAVMIVPYSLKAAWRA